MARTISPLDMKFLVRVLQGIKRLGRVPDIGNQYGSARRLYYAVSYLREFEYITRSEQKLILTNAGEEFLTSTVIQEARKFEIKPADWAKLDRPADPLKYVPQRVPI